MNENFCPFPLLSPRRWFYLHEGSPSFPDVSGIVMAIAPSLLLGAVLNVIFSLVKHTKKQPFQQTLNVLLA